MSERGRRAERQGRVVSNKMDKTAVVAVESRFQHPVYRRVVRRTRKYMAHDEENTCQIGDVVRIRETRPISKHKRWRLVEVVQRAR